MKVQKRSNFILDTSLKVDDQRIVLLEKMSLDTHIRQKNNKKIKTYVCKIIVFFALARN